MKSIFVVLAGLAAVALSAAPFTGTDNAANRIADNYIVVMKPDLHESVVKNHLDSVRAQSVGASEGRKGFVRSYQIEKFNAYHIECDEATVQDLQNHELVNYIAHDTLVRLDAPLDTPLPESLGQFIPKASANSWGLGRISHRLANITTYASVGLKPGNKPSIAYVVDSGIRITHHEFGKRARWGATFIDNTVDDDQDGHGTHVAGIIMGHTTGVDNTTHAIAVKVIDGGQGPISAMMAGLNWAVQHAQNASHVSRSVINISLGSAYNQVLNDAIQATVAAGMTVVVAAGNDGIDACKISPASAPDAITVGAIDSLDNRVCNYGQCVDIFAPGMDILSTFNRNDEDYAHLSGTSMASPHVAGLAAYLIARGNLTTPEAVWRRIMDLATEGQVINATDDSPNLIAFNGNPVELNK